VGLGELLGYTAKTRILKAVASRWCPMMDNDGSANLYYPLFTVTTKDKATG
jgi:hypothetical protein